MGKAIGGVPEPPALRSDDRGARRAADPAAAPGSAAREPARPPAGAGSPPGDDVGGIGAYLARQRRLRGLGLDEVAALTRIPRRSLERLEAGAFDAPPDGFARGFVRTVADAIGLDPEDTVSRMLHEPQAPGRATLAGLGRSMALLAALAAGLVLVGVLVRLSARVASAPDEPSLGPPPTELALPVRRDHVRALAAEEGLLAPEPVTSPE